MVLSALKLQEVTSVDVEMREFLEPGIRTPSRMRAVELNAEYLGVSSLQMMESAGKALADIIRHHAPDNVLILCGKGNNGGDGMVAARHVQDLEPVIVYHDDTGMSRQTACQLSVLKHCSVTVFPVRCRDDVIALNTAFSAPGLILDAMLGTGSSGNPREPIKTMVDCANSSSTTIISADVPTPGIKASEIIAFHRPKVSGSHIVDIGIPLEAECFVGPGDLTVLKKKDPGAHKGAGGEVLIVGGGPYQGAPYLAGLGALRAGADIARIASPVFEPVPDLIYEFLPGTIVGKEHVDRILGLAEKADVVLVGNGLGDQSHDVVTSIAHSCKKVVFDADALRLPLPVAEESIYTPHAGEFTRITGQAPEDGLVARARTVKNAAKYGTILLKGPVDIISDGDRVRFNRSGSPLMTVGGTGDVLAGVTAALFCNNPAFDAACSAAYVNGKAGEAVGKHIGGGMIPRDLADRIPLELFKGGNSNG
jgi:yjeF C-terminal region, hydroxyethylthiazole kinase-related/yjeF N-terminal region